MFAAPSTAFGIKPSSKEETKKSKKQVSAPTAEVTEQTKRHFRQVFDRIDGELVKLTALE